MKIAALVMAHHRPDLLTSLAKRLSGGLWNVYLHLDKKSDRSAFDKIPARAFLSEHAVMWGGYSTTAAILSLVRFAVSDPENTHFYLMSGQCFPIKSDDEIAATIDGSGGNFMTAIKMPVWHKPLERLTGWYVNDLRHPLLRRVGARIAAHWPQRNVQRSLHGLSPYGGSTWWLLSRPTIERMIAFIDANRWYPRAFHWTLIPDECFFQTLAVHLGTVIDRPSPTFTKWVPGASHPLPIDDEILCEARLGWHLMARKFTTHELAGLQTVRGAHQ